MTVYKNNRGEVKEFEFGQLTPSKSKYKAGEISNFELQSFKNSSDFKNNITADVIRGEREFEASKRFNIDPKVREHRGLRAQEIADFEQSVNEEVARRLELVKQQAFEEGFTAGQSEGQEQAYNEAVVHYQDRIEVLASFIDEVTLERKKLMDDSRDNGYKLIKNLTKWVVLKEVEDKEYIGRLLEKLILEINTKSNLLIRVNQEDFSSMPEVVEMVEAKLGKMTNVRVEVDQDMKERGIVLESEVGVIDASLQAQLASIDKLFESVGIVGQDGE